MKPDRMESIVNEFINYWIDAYGEAQTIKDFIGLGWEKEDFEYFGFDMDEVDEAFA